MYKNTYIHTHTHTTPALLTANKALVLAVHPDGLDAQDTLLLRCFGRVVHKLAHLVWRLVVEEEVVVAVAGLLVAARGVAPPHVARVGLKLRKDSNVEYSGTNT